MSRSRATRKRGGSRQAPKKDDQLTVLIVDDLDVNRKLLNIQLTSAGHRVIEAVDGEQAMRILRRKEVDAIVSDILMPKMDGYQLCLQVRRLKKFSSTPFIFHSATYTSPADDAFALSIGADAVLKKPIKPELLLKAILKVRRRSSHRRSVRIPSQGTVARQYAERLAMKLEEKNAELEKKQADLTSRKELLRTLIESAAELILLTDEGGRILSANAAALRATGQTQEVLRKFHLLDLVDPEHRARVTDLLFTQQRSHSGPQYIEVPIRTVAGHVLWLGLNATPRILNGRFDGSYLIARDITDLKKAEHALRESERHYRLLFESNPLPMWVYDRATLKFLAVNNAAVSHYGFTREEFLSMTIEDIRPPEELPRLRREVGLNGSSIRNRGTWRHRTKEGRPIDVDITGHDIVFDGHEARLILANDITERLRLQNEVAARERQQRSFFSGATAGLAIWDRELRYVQINEMLAEINGWTVAEHLGRTIHDLLPDLELTLGPLLLSVFNTGKPVLNIEISGQTRKIPGKVRHWNASYFPIQSPNGEVEGVGGIVVETTELRSATEALSASEAELRALFSSMEDVVMVLDQSGRYLSIAPTKANKLYREAEDLLGRSVREIMKEDEARPILDAIERALENQQTVRIEYRLAIGNAVTWFEGNVAPMGRDKVIWVARDITDRKESEETLAEMHRQLKYLFDNLDEAFYSVELIGNRMLQASPALGRMFGVPLSDFYRNALLWYEMILPEDRLMIDRNMAVLREGRSIRQQFRIRRGDGAVRWIESMIKPTLGDDGVLQRIDGISFDITDRREAEHRLREQAELLDKAKESISVRDLEGTILYWNKGSERLYGWTSDEAVGRNVFELLKTNASEVVEVAKATVMRTGEWVGEFHHTTKSAATVIVESHWTLVRDHDGKPRSIFVLNTDITESTHLRTQLAHAQKMESLGTLAGGIAHDFNNILGIIIAHASLLEIHGHDPARVKDGVRKVNVAAERGAGLVRQLLTFARKSEVVLAEVNVNDIVHEVATLLHQTMPKSIQIELILAPALPVIVADNNQLHQVLVNLSVNARDAMTRGGMLTISTSVTPGRDLKRRFPQASASDFVHLTVADTGMGMDDATKARIFEPFFTTKAHGKGTGLGLATVFGIVENHKGYIDVSSVPGEGTTFHIWFPVHFLAKAQTREQGPVPVEITGGTETILIIEDERELMSALRNSLEKFGYQLLIAEDGAAGLQQFAERQEEIHLVLTDLGLPKVDGTSVVGMIREMGSDVPIVVTSGFVEPEARVELERLGVEEILAKPYEVQSVLRLVRSILDRRLDRSRTAER